MSNNILSKFKPSKILGKGSEGIVILTHNSKYTVKIYFSNYLKSKLFLNIVRFFQEYDNLPKTIYKSYFFTYKENSIDRYLNKYNLPNHLSYKNNKDLELLLSKYTMKKKLFEIMKIYDISLKKFIKNLKSKNIDIQLKINILNSLFYQGLITLYWLYMIKGIVHGDITLDNFFVQRTNNEYFNININNVSYKIKLFGYYLVISDFGHAHSVEFTVFNTNPYKVSILLLYNIYNPLNDITDFVKLFKTKFLNYNVHNIKVNNCFIPRHNLDYELKVSLKKILKSYIFSHSKLENNIKKFKKLFTIYMHKNVFSKIEFV